MTNKGKIWVIVFISLSFIGTFITFIFNSDAPTVSDLKIPQSTIDFFKKIDDLGHTKFDWVDSLDIGDFDNDNDYDHNFKKLEDENFIVYYRSNNEEKVRAEKTLKYANQAVPELSDFFGKYYYAKDVKNRKLAIYLAVSEDDFAEISQEVGGSTVDWAAGLTFNSFSSDGETICNGIVLNSMVQDGEGTDLKKVVFHEMAHYNHFQCMDLIHKDVYMNWEVEGLASYFAKDWNKVIPDNININEYNLLKDPANYIDSYWMGYHVFNVFEEKYDKEGFHNMLNESYSKSLKIAIPNVSGSNFDLFQNTWRSHCNRLKGRLSASRKIQ
jgi:hypothetical protein